MNGIDLIRDSFDNDCELISTMNDIFVFVADGNKSDYLERKIRFFSEEYSEFQNKDIRIVTSDEFISGLSYGHLEFLNIILDERWYILKYDQELKVRIEELLNKFEGTQVLEKKLKEDFKQMEETIDYHVNAIHELVSKYHIKRMQANLVKQSNSFDELSDNVYLEQQLSKVDNSALIELFKYYDTKMTEFNAVMHNVDNIDEYFNAILDNLWTVLYSHYVSREERLRNEDK